MQNHASASDSGALFLSGALLFGLLWHYSRSKAHFDSFKLILIASLALTALLLFAFTTILLRRHKLNRAQLKPQQWDSMSGTRFEDQMVIWLKSCGYNPVVKTQYYDWGIDILATKDAISYGVQVKRSARRVGVNAVRAAVAGLNSYGCDQAMVLTNATFTTQAQSLARTNNCLLIDGSELLRQAKLAQIKPD